MPLSSSPLIQRLLNNCQLNQRSIVLPESTDPRVLNAVDQLVKQKAASAVYLCSTEAEGIKNAKALGLDPKGWSNTVRWVFDEFPRLQEELKTTFQERMTAKGKSITPEDARHFSQSPLSQAGYLVQKGVASAALAGCVATTADVIRACLNTVGLAPGIKTISGSFLMDRHHPGLDSHTFLYADSGVVIEPTVDQLVDIAAASVQTMQKLVPHQEPVVAFLSFSTKGSARHPSAEKMASAAAKFSALYPAICADGELQFDAAFIAEVGQRKCPQSPAAGKANCFIFPSLDAGNIAYKITQRLGMFAAYGPILQGTAHPYSDLSRGASVDDIVVSSYICMERAVNSSTPA